MADESQKREFWNSRADLGETSGTNDFMLKNLELQLLLEKVAPQSSVLDVGCGNGESLISLAKMSGCTGVGLDFSEKMIGLAQSGAQSAGLNRQLTFQHSAIPGLPTDLGQFDYALSERCLINLDSERTQRAAFLEIMAHVKPGGSYLMIESSMQGLERTNELRHLLDLEPIAPPWHNVFLHEESVQNWVTPEYSLEEVIPFSSTYHLFSRVVYARLAADAGEDLRYDSDLNVLACRLPVIGNFGPVRLWHWRRGPQSAK